MFIVVGDETRPDVSVSFSSGQRNLEVAREAGMLMTQDEIRACGLMSSEMYETRTLPAMVA